MPVQLIKLRQIADARSGDKGNNANVGIIAHNEESYAYLQEALTEAIVFDFFKPMGVHRVIRYELPNLLAFNFILEGILDGGGSRSLRLDPQGKALGQVMLDLTLEAPLNLAGSGSGSLVLCEYPQPGVCVVTLNRPEKRNALNIELLQQLSSRLETARQSPSLRVLVFNASGSSFCAGMDLNDASDPFKVERSAALIAATLTLLVDAPFVTIAAAHGVAAGGGAGLLSACDLAVAADDLKIIYPEVRRGLVPAQVAPLLMRLLPRHIVHELLFTGEPISAARALSLGLVNQIANTSNLLEEALKMASLVKKGAPEAIRQTKKLLQAIDRKTFAQDLEITLPFHHQSRHSPEAEEGSRAFLEKRLPSWQ